jgi:hypothetical protein
VLGRQEADAGQEAGVSAVQEVGDSARQEADGGAGQEVDSGHEVDSRWMVDGGQKQDGGQEVDICHVLLCNSCYLAFVPQGSLCNPQAACISCLQATYPVARPTLCGPY